MIYSRFGSPLTILEDKGEGWVKVRRHADGAIREWHISELKADGGFKEINEAIERTKG